MRHTHPRFDHKTGFDLLIHTKPIAILTFVFGASTATAAPAGVTFTGIERSVSAGSISTSSDLTEPFDVDLPYEQSTGGVFAPATARAQQSSSLDLSSETLTFVGLAQANGGALADADASSMLTLSFIVAPGMPTEMVFDGSLTARDGFGNEPGMLGGRGFALINLSLDGTTIFSRSAFNTSPGGNTSIVVDDVLELDAGSYELSLEVIGTGPVQVSGGRGTADLSVAFVVPAPGAAAIALAAGAFTARRRRSQAAR